MNESRRDSASFGFREVPADEKSGLVKGVFDRVADRYDLMNDVMSAGVHRFWKSAFVDRIAPRAGELLFDVAGGTGDIAERLIARAGAPPGRPPARAVICDVNLEMLKAGARRASGAPDGTIARLCADAENLPFPDQTADVYAIAFGVRNITRIDRALAEARRVLKFGGRFFCLEFSRLATEGLQRLYDEYSHRVIPWLGETVAGDRASYEYLVQSIRRFPSQEKFAAMIAAAGLQRVRCENLSAGVVAIHSAWRI
jgi:demethylmenaquinone methyltransferase/2-methoxy-6-polyprenyl-1,4-benzoquinol methylase